MKTIEIIVDNKGECTAQTKGFMGTACRDASKFIERALGVVQSDTPTAEAYGTAVIDQRLHQSEG